MATKMKTVDVGRSSAQVKRLQSMLNVRDIRTGKPIFVRPGNSWKASSLDRLLREVLKGAAPLLIAILFLAFGACRQEGLVFGPDGGSQADLPDSSVSLPDLMSIDVGTPLAEPSVDGSAVAVDKPVDIQPSPDLSVGDLPSDPVAKSGDEVQPDVSPDLSSPKPDVAPDLFVKKDAEPLLGSGKSCTLDDQCQAGNHCSSLVGRCCLTSCLETGCWKGCGTDGLCIWCTTCTCTSNGQCHC